MRLQKPAPSSTRLASSPRNAKGGLMQNCVQKTGRGTARLLSFDEKEYLGNGYAVRVRIKIPTNG